MNTPTENLTRLDPRDPSLGLADTVDRIYAVEGRGFVLRDTRYRHDSRWISVATLGDLTHRCPGGGRNLLCGQTPTHVSTRAAAIRLMPSGACR